MVALPLLLACRLSRARGWLRHRGTSRRIGDPIREMHGADDSRRIGRQRALLKQRSEVARAPVRDYFARVSSGLHQPAEEIIELETIGACDLHRSIDRLFDGDLGEGR